MAAFGDVFLTDIQSKALAEFREQVFKRVAFLGMQNGDVTSFVDLCASLALSDAESKSAPADARKLAKALTRYIGKPRANLFMTWLLQKIPDVHRALSTAESSKQDSIQNSAAKTESKCSDRLQQQRQQQTPSAQGRISKVVKQPHAPKTDEKCISDDSWVQVTSKDGKTYYWNRKANSCHWSLPVGIRAAWVSHRSAEGRTYYSDRKGASFWVLPPLQTCCKSPAELTQKTQTDVSQEGAKEVTIHTSASCEVVPQLGKTMADALPVSAVDSLETPVVACSAASPGITGCKDVGRSGLDEEKEIIPTPGACDFRARRCTVFEKTTPRNTPRTCSRSPRRKVVQAMPIVSDKNSTAASFAYQQMRRASSGGA